ncbi:MAG: P-loop NTPase [Candidatus Eisenbacteria bacterium]|nr:P-loop NTPase [Candidatus Latescibacterota bacterium]MBD3301530.1 P-loop NTPase [Candidatus Eisenbacteria bacterium]
MGLTEQAVEALRTVPFPGLGRDIVALGYVKDIQERDGRAVVSIEMSTKLPEAADRIRQAAGDALDRAGVPHELEIQVRSPAAEAPAPEAPQPQPQPTPALLQDVPVKIAVASGKGGVGKSTVAVNLALAFARQGGKVGLLDCDVYGPSVPLMMGMESERPEVRDGKLVPLSRYDVRTISIGYLIDRETPVIWRGPMAGKALDQLMGEVDWTGVEMLILDLPPGTGDIQITLAQKISLSGAVVVTTPQDVALIDAAKGVSMFHKVDVSVLGIVENMSAFACPHCGETTEIFRSGGGRREAERLGIPLLGSIPIDPRIPVGGDTGVPIVVQDPDSAPGRAFLDAARAIRERIR